MHFYIPSSIFQQQQSSGQFSAFERAMESLSQRPFSCLLSKDRHQCITVFIFLKRTADNLSGTIESGLIIRSGIHHYYFLSLKAIGREGSVYWSHTSLGVRIIDQLFFFGTRHTSAQTKASAWSALPTAKLYSPSVLGHEIYTGNTKLHPETKNLVH